MRAVGRRYDDGAALMIALGLLAVLAMLGGAFVVFMRIEQSRGEYELDALRAGYLARGGIEAARLRVETAQDPSGVIESEIAGGNYAVRIEQTDGVAYEADAIGTLTRRDGSVVTARIVVRMRPAAAGVRVETWQE
jgi:hypothetical protein